MSSNKLHPRLPADPVMLMSVVNTLLRDNYMNGLDELCDDMAVSRTDLEDILRGAGFEYSKDINQFR